MGEPAAGAATNQRDPCLWSGGAQPLQRQDGTEQIAEAGKHAHDSDPRAVTVRA